MKRHNPSFSLYAFLIALLVHIVIVLLLAFIEKIAPTPPPPQKEEKPSESRFKVSLKEQPKAQKEALVKNTIPKPTKARPMPKGEQLKTPTPKAKPQPKIKPKEKQQQSAPKAQPEASPKETTATPTEPKKAFERHVAKEVATIDRTPKPKQEKGLYDILSKADTTSKPSSGSSAKISDNIQKLYGDKFGELSEGEQKYILDNQEIMRRITQTTLDRYGRARIPDNLKADETNMIEFYLHPDGSISDIRFLKNSRFSILDDTTKETIEIAYSKYPRPAQKTYIRYRVWYNLN